MISIDRIDEINAMFDDGAPDVKPLFFIPIPRPVEVIMPSRENQEAVVQWVGNRGGVANASVHNVEVYMGNFSSITVNYGRLLGFDKEHGTFMVITMDELDNGYTPA